MNGNSQGELEGETQSGVEAGDGGQNKEMRNLIILTCPV